MGKSYKSSGRSAPVSSRFEAGRLKIDVAMSVELMERSREMVHGFLSELGRMTLESLLEASAEQVAGARSPGSRAKAGPTRHGYESGSVRLGVRKVAVDRPRLRQGGKEVEVPLYGRLRRDPGLSAKVYQAGVAGLSTRRVEPVLDASGLARSQVSRHLIDEMESRYEELGSRAIDKRMLVVLMDGMHVGGHLLLSAVGMDEAGKKHVLGIREGSTENAEVARSLLSDLILRGLSASTGILFILDGAKALSSAVKALFPHARSQRCRVHKLRNVEDHLPESKKPYVRAAMQAAWKLPIKEGVGRMEDLAKELQVERPGAAGSLREGLEETFTVNGLGLPPLLIPGLATTNIIENCHGAIGQRMRRVTNVQNGKMALRWAASALLEAEPNMRTVKGFKHLWMLKASLDNELAKKAQ